MIIKGAAVLSRRSCLHNREVAPGWRIGRFISVFLASVLVCAANLALLPSPTAAGILSKLLREAGEAGGKAGKHGIGSLDNAASALRKLPDGDAKTALAVHATPEGHWVLVNKKGEQFTAGTPDELNRAPKTLLGTAADGKPLALYLTEDTVFEQAARLKDLPANAKLNIVSRKKAYRLVPSPDQATGFTVQVRPNLNVALTQKAMLHEALFRLQRSLNSANIRILALEPGGPKRLSSVPGRDPKTKRRLTESVDPADLKSALGKLKGQTVVVTGEVKGSRLHFEPSAAPAGQVELKDLAEAARGADVNLVVLQSSSPTQPGAKTWLWQTVEIDGLETTLKRPTFADFLQSVTANSGDLLIEANQGVRGRLVFTATPTGSLPGEVTGQIRSWIDVVSEQVTGTVATNGIIAYTRNRDQENEHTLRLVPGIPSTLQILYAMGLFAGLMGLGVAREWWRKLWPQEKRQEYAGNFGYQAARVARGIAFVLLFLPLVGTPAVIWTYLRPLIFIILAPFRFIGRLLGLTRS